MLDSRSVMALTAVLLLNSPLFAQSYLQVSPSTAESEPQVVQPRKSFPALNHQAKRTAREETSTTSSSPVSGPMVTVTSSLAVVLGLFAAMIWVTRRYSTNAAGNRAVPREALEILGSTTVEPRFKVTLLRVGSRVVVLAQTPQGIQPITEITQLDEVQRLIATLSGSSQQDFAQELMAIEREPHPRGFVASEAEPPPRRRLFATA